MTVFQIGVVAAAAGSAYADFGSTKVILSLTYSSSKGMSIINP